MLPEDERAADSRDRRPWHSFARSNTGPSKSKLNPWPSQVSVEDLDETTEFQDHCLRPPMRTPFIGPLYRPLLSLQSDS
jgi:hypothetical protein